MSERSERTTSTVFIAAWRRCGHWCPVGTEPVESSHIPMVHQ